MANTRCLSVTERISGFDGDDAIGYDCAADDVQLSSCSVQFYASLSSSAITTGRMMALVANPAVVLKHNGRHKR